MAALKEGESYAEPGEYTGGIADQKLDEAINKYLNSRGFNYNTADDPDYQAWVAANCESSCPDGERKDDFSDRVCRTFAALVDKALADGEEMLVILAHGGTQMAALERYGVPRRSYYRWCGPNAGGYVLDARDWAARHELRLVKTVQYTKESTC